MRLAFFLSLVLVVLHAPESRGQQPLSSEQQIEAARLAGQSQRVDLDQYVQGGERRLDAAMPQSTSDSEVLLPLPFGSNLFQSGIEATRQSGINPSYRVAAGDKVSVQLWGAVNFSDVMTVDNQGNIFIPEVGPVAVADIPAGELNGLVTNRIKSVYPNNVNIYVNLLASTPVGVFVSGPVERPGQYAGLASDSILHYLKRAGGIDPDRGSFRKVSVLRDGNVMAQFDLYEFLRNGKLATFSFRDNDVVLVGQQGQVITVEGAAKNAFRFELNSAGSRGEDLMRYANPLPKTSHVAITGTRENGPISLYMPLADFKEFVVGDGDTVLFNDDLRPQVISVRVSGSYIGPSFYAVKADTRLHELLAYIEVDEQSANVGSIYLKRESVAARQAELLEESLQRLERSVFTAPASSDGEARIRTQEAQLVMQFIERARQVVPIGKVVVASNGKIANVRLEQGDEIVIPAKTDLVQVAGEVLMPQALVYNSAADVNDYIAWAGGFTERANDERIAIVHPNGLLTFVDSSQNDHWFGRQQSSAIQPGDQILVLPAVDNKLLQSVKDITQIIYQIAVAANVAID